MTAKIDPRYADRILADSEADRENWLGVRESLFGASDAAQFAKPASADTYLRNKLNPKPFRGNAYTDSGNLWEPRMLAWAQIPRNTLLIRSLEERGLGATPDGILSRPDGLVLAEAKAKHGKTIYKPTPAELRQIAFQQWVLGPEVLYTEWIWAQIEDGDLVGLEPQSIRFYPGDLETVLAGVLAIALPLAIRHQAALQFAKETGL